MQIRIYTFDYFYRTKMKSGLLLLLLLSALLNLYLPLVQTIALANEIQQNYMIIQ